MKGIGIITGIALSLWASAPLLAQGVTTTITGQNGKTTTSTATTNKNGNTTTINRTTTYPNGKTTTGTNIITREGNTTNFNRSTVYPNGKTSNTTGSTTYTNNGNGNGTFTGTGTRTNRNGEVSNYSLEGQRNRTGDTITKTGTITNTSTGNQTTFNNNRTCNQGQCNFNRVSTDSQGRNRTVTGTADRNSAGSWNGNFNVTRRNGTTGSGTFTRKRN